MGDIARWCNSIDGRLKVATHQIESFVGETAIGETDMRGDTVAHVEDGILHEYIAILDEIFVEDLFRDQQTGARFLRRFCGESQTQRGQQDETDEFWVHFDCRKKRKIGQIELILNEIQSISGKLWNDEMQFNWWSEELFNLPEEFTYFN